MAASTIESPDSSQPILSVKDFGLRFHERMVLRSVTLEVPSRGCTVLLGPSGTGKSSLLRTLAGFNDQHPAMYRWGEVEYAGRPLSSDNHPALVMQKTQLMVANVLDNLQTGLPDRSRLTRAEQIDTISATVRDWNQDWIIEEFQVPVVNLSLGQQRIVAILRELLSQPPLLLLDEPTTGMNEQDASQLLALVTRLAETQAVLIVLHHLGQARQVADHIALLASGQIQESVPAAQFFAQPVSAAGQNFLRTGSCPEDPLEPENEVQHEHHPEAARNAEAQVVSAEAASIPVAAMGPTLLDEEDESDRSVNHLHVRMPMPRMELPPEPSAPQSASAGPRGFVWLLPGRLAGTPWPGILREVESDLDDLRHVGIHRLVSLTEDPFDAVMAARYGIAVSHCAIVDMKAPTATQAARLCADIDGWIAYGESVALHCKAGLGRTGTMLAAYWLWRGHGLRSAVDSIEQVRRLNANMIQSTVQVAFLSDFARYLTASRNLRQPAEIPLDLGQWSGPSSFQPTDLSSDRRSS